MKRNRLGFLMAESISAELATEIAEIILKGAKVVDASKIFSVDYIQCREALHRYCREQNPVAYKALNTDAANLNDSSPHITALQENRDKFLIASNDEQPKKSRAELVDEINHTRHRLKTGDLELRENRIKLALLSHELTRYEHAV